MTLSTSTRQSRTLWVIGLFPLVAALGCESKNEWRDGSARRRETDSAGRLLPGTTIDKVKTVAHNAFTTRYRLDREASTALDLVSQPTEVGAAGSDPTRVRDLVRPAPNRRRQLARLWFTQQGPDVLIRCRILNQRMDTAERQAFANYRSDDRPDETPIDREGPTSVSGREEWINVGRDRQAENELLDAIEQVLYGGS